MKRNRAAWVLMGIVVVLVGCIGGEPEPLPPGQPSAAMPAPGSATAAPAPAPATPIAPPTSPVPAVPTPAAGQAVQAAPPAPVAAPQVAADPWAGSEASREQAKVGVGKKGRGYGGGLITTPIAAYFGVQERLAFKQVFYNMKLYMAEHGSPPKTQEEFMEKIIKAGAIQLPQLRGNDRYVYLPEKVNLSEEDSGLWIEHPAE